jgi:hypothetical protein
MRTVTATAPTGVGWAVRVVWLPRWRPLARRFGGWRRKHRGPDVDLTPGLDVPSGGGGGGGFLDGLADDLAVAVVVIVGLLLFGLLAWWVLIPLLLLAVDAIVVVLLFVVAILTRVLLRRPWTVEATTPAAGGGEDRFATEVVGWREALRSRDEIAGKLRAGYPAPVVGTLHHRP